MEIAVTFLVPTEIRFQHDTWKRSPCPGAELSVVHTARSLAQAEGLAVHVLSPGLELGTYDNVYYAPDPGSRGRRRGITVHVRDYNSLPDPLQGRHVLWVHDTSREILSLMAAGTTLRDMLMRFDALVFVSAWHRREVLAAAGLPEGSLTTAVAYHPLPDTPMVTEKKQARLIHTAHPRKAILHVLDAFAHVVKSRPDAELVLCGHPEIYQSPYLDAHGKPVTLAGLADQLPGDVRARVIVLPQSLPQESLLTEVGRAEILLHPDTSTETGATTVLEAMAVGTVPVVSDVGCLPELCWGRGLVVPAFNRSVFAESVADATLALLDCPRSRSAMAAEALGFGRSRSDRQTICEPWLRLFRSLTGVCPDPGPVPKQEKRTFVACSDPGAERHHPTWDDLVNQSPDAWVTHSSLWFDSCERHLGNGFSDWELLVDAQSVVGIIPLVEYDGVLVSGAIEPSGPLLSSRTGFGEAGRAAEMLVCRLEEKAARHQRLLVLRFGVFGRGGFPAQTHPFIAPLLDRKFEVAIQQAHVFRRGWSWVTHASSRLRTQIRSAGRWTEIVAAESEDQCTIAYQLYTSHNEKKRSFSLSCDALRALLSAGYLRTKLCVLHGAFVGFSYSLVFGDAASVLAWGVEDDALADGVAKVLVARTIQSLLEEVHVVEVGTVFDAGEYSNISEFYRRLGGGRAAYMVARKDYARKPDPFTYAVI